MEQPDGSPELSRFERTAVELLRFTNERDLLKRLQFHFNRTLTWAWVFQAIGGRVYVDNIDWLADWQPDRGVVLAGNHRSFFDHWISMLSVFGAGVDWLDRFYFPVRSNFFYEKVPGLMVNMLVGMGAMYPPIFRERAKAALNRDAVERLIAFLQRPGTAVGVHPEGTRGKGPDPYELLPAQPGVGEIVLKSKPTVVPFFVHGMTNSFLGEIVATRKPEARRDRPIIIVYGEPVDLSDFDGKTPRPALYKRCSDRLRDAIAALIPRERELRARCAAGEVPADDPGWLLSRVAARPRNHSPQSSRSGPSR